jgi:hypothetical protein
MIRRRAVLVLCVLLALATQACGGGSDRSFTIGFKRLSLDLSYQDESIPTPTRADVLTPQPVPSLAAFLTQVRVPQQLQSLPPMDSGTCAAAPADAHPEHPATVFVTEPPKIGTYTTHNKGTATIQGAVAVKLPFPPRGLLTVQNITHSDAEDPANGPTKIFTYDVFTPSLDGGGTTTTYRVTYSPATLAGTVGQTAGGSHAPQGELDLVRLQIKTASGDIDFNPDPPITIMAFKNGQGTTWRSAGIDRADNTSMVVDGSVTKRTNVDVCGKLYDTYEVVSNEHIVNLTTGLRSDTSATDPNVYHVATNYGGLFIQQHIDTTTSFPGESGTPTIITAVYDQTFDAITPVGG